MNWLIILWLLIITLAENANSEESSWNCQFDESGLLLNFQKLHKNDDYIINHETKNETFRIQICGSLHKNCNGIPGYSACLEFGNKTEKGLGRVVEHSHDDGRIMYKYTGDKCKDDVNYQLRIIMICDYGAIDSYPELFPYEKNYCSFFIIWRTVLACPSYPSQTLPSISCKVTDKNGTVYDLSDLKELDTNYEVAIDKNTSIILNICHPVVYGYRAVCLDNSGACLRINSDKLKYKSLGSINSMKLNAEPLVLEYEMGDLCPNKLLHFRTTITFVCDYNATNTAPVFIGIENVCHYKLNWRTAAACNEKDLEEFSSKTAEPCKITNPVTKMNYDLNSLKGKETIVKTKAGLEYKFTICKPLQSNACQASVGGKDAGVCSASKRTIGGKANSKLLWNVHGPYLNYTDGSPCGENKNRSTQITFVCAPEGAENMNTIDDDDPCHLRIHYHTSLVCENKKSLTQIIQSHI
ncbi:hypothetical protein PV327_000121 [Microctonus hyperodae]|uniref:MRH domain-containing protein n=1 Tax=Microctonus hyperodae TaxID=165561 RepID=A0AA39L1M8_MICHY|nr:hypothetical protein PV327_000121 [Microctonus hyperodae]